MKLLDINNQTFLAKKRSSISVSLPIQNENISIVFSIYISRQKQESTNIVLKHQSTSKQQFPYQLISNSLLIFYPTFMSTYKTSMTQLFAKWQSIHTLSQYLYFHDSFAFSRQFFIILQFLCLCYFQPIPLFILLHLLISLFLKAISMYKHKFISISCKNHPQFLFSSLPAF